MMSASIRRKALSLCSSALNKNGQPALAGSTARGYIVGNPMFEEFVGRSRPLAGLFQGALAYSKPSRHADFLTHKWIRSLSTYNEPAIRAPLAQVQNNQGNFAAEIGKTINKRTHSGPAFFTTSGAAVVTSQFNARKTINPKTNN